jgi:hypothetical protein
MTRQTASLLLPILVLFGSCSTAPQKLEHELNPPVEEWLDAFEAKCLSKEHCLILIRGVFDVQKMEVLKKIGFQRKNGMSALARVTKKKIDESISGPVSCASGSPVDVYSDGTLAAEQRTEIGQLKRNITDMGTNQSEEIR